MEQPTFLGIDLTGSGRRPSAYALLDACDEVLDLGYLGDDADILRLVERRAPRFVALDAPFGLPKGLCCLEESCPCSPESPQPGRACERELASRYGIPCFWTTKRTIIKAMVYRAIALRAALEERGAEVLETYPTPSKCGCSDAISRRRALARAWPTCGVVFLRCSRPWRRGSRRSATISATPWWRRMRRSCTTAERPRRWAIRRKGPW